MRTLEVIKRDLFEEDKQIKKIRLWALGLAIIFHIILFVGIRNFKSKPKMYKANANRKVFKPIKYVIPKKKIEKQQIKKTKNVYKPRNRPIPKAVPDPKVDEALPEIPEDMIEDDTQPIQQIEPGAIIPPMLVYKHIPDYPEIARTMGLEGDVAVVCTLDDKGKVVRVRLLKSSGSDALDKAAMNAAKFCKFTPAIQNDKPVGDIDVEITYRFKLEGIEITTE